MKRNKILTITLILAMIVSLAFPVLAASEGELPANPEQEETVQPPEETAADPVPGGEEDQNPAPDPGGELPTVPADPAEGEDFPPASEGIQSPGGEETPGEGEDPAQPSEGGEAPVEGEENPDTETPEEEAPDGEAPEEDQAAEDEEGEPDSQEEPRVIDVVVPPSGQVIVNPYQMPVATSSGESTEQIVHEPQVMISGSDFPVLVTARAVGKLQPGSEARFASAPPAADALDKQIFMYVEFQSDPMLWSGSFADWSNQILVTDWGMEKANVMTLDAFGAGYFRLFGAMTGFPDVMWDAVDAPDVTLTFTFAPLEMQPETENSVFSGETFAEEDFPEETLPAENLPAGDGYLPEGEEFPAEEDLTAPEDMASEA